MGWQESAAALLVGRGLRVGPLRLTAFGAFAAAGVVAATALTGSVARRFKLSPEAVWDVALFAVVCCLAISRLLLVIGDPQAFARYPAIVLGLPSLTFGGMALSALAVWVYLRRKRLPLLPTLDAFAPGAALVAGFLEAGHWLDGSEAGMPVGFARHPGPWGNDAIHLYPVSLLGLLLAFSLCAALWWLARKDSPPGRLASLGLVAGGAMAFGLDALSLPTDLAADRWLEPGEWVALGAMLTGAGLWTSARRGLASPRSGSVPATTTLPSSNAENTQEEGR